MLYLNTVPHADVVSDVAPFTIVQGKITDFALHCQADFGAYAQTRNLTKNNMRVCTTRVIMTMGPSMNYQGNVIFCRLSTGMVLNRSKMTSPVSKCQRTSSNRWHLLLNSHSRFKFSGTDWITHMQMIRRIPAQSQYDSPILPQSSI